MAHINRRPCRFFLQGHCRYGDRCRFAHPLTDERQEAQPSSHKPLLKPRVCAESGCKRFTNRTFCSACADSRKRGQRQVRNLARCSRCNRELAKDEQDACTKCCRFLASALPAPMPSRRPPPAMSPAMVFPAIPPAVPPAIPPMYAPTTWAAAAPTAWSATPTGFAPPPAEEGYDPANPSAGYPMFAPPTSPSYQEQYNPCSPSYTFPEPVPYPTGRQWLDEQKF